MLGGKSVFDEKGHGVVCSISEVVLPHTQREEAVKRNMQKQRDRTEVCNLSPLPPSQAGRAGGRVSPPAPCPGRCACVVFPASTAFSFRSVKHKKKEEIHREVRVLEAGGIHKFGTVQSMPNHVKFHTIRESSKKRQV